uniref:uncharacterized protein LOC120329521 isoform X1 n=1 Tax=Styela clava TaxID=7725 RepID=UPI00193ACD48|nr:uncharacterized protein LOC120329521 isoform X1 [Styela clava]
MNSKSICHLLYFIIIIILHFQFISNMITKAVLQCAKGLIFRNILASQKYYFATQTWNIDEKYLKIHPAVKDALSSKKPVVALESTIITHGMPYPDNYETALEVEEIVKSKSVTPATIAIIDGQIHIGLTKDNLHTLATSPSSIKISRRGVPASIAFKQTGGTTVSATMMLAHRCNIPIFVTGGIGGVHRDGENTLDISSDLTELGRTPVTVISAGVKSILDIQRTLEFLETQGVTVATFGQNNDFPAFFTQKSGHKSQFNVKNASKAAQLIKSSQDLEMDSGCLIAVPLPDEFATSGERIENAIKTALAEAESSSIKGPDVTPYILKRVNEITGGESLKANVALIKHNASVGADIAVELAKCFSNSEEIGVATPVEEIQERPVVIGGTNIDVIAKCTSEILYDGPSNPADISYTLGGVARNIAEGLCRYNDNPVFISALGDDGHAQMVRMEMKEYMDLSFIEKIQEYNSGLYNAVFDVNGSLKVGIESMKVHEMINIETIMKNEDVISQAPLVCIDANLTSETIAYICDLCDRRDLDLFFEPTGSLKAGRPFLDNLSWKSIKYLTPNLQEFEVIMSAITGKEKKINLNENGKFIDSTLPAIYETCRPLLEHVYCLIVTLAGKGVATFVQDDSKSSGIKATHYPLTSMPQFEWMFQPIVNVSGSGDAFAAAYIHGLLQGKESDICTKMGLVAAQFSLRSNSAVPSTLNTEIFDGIENVKWDTQEL